MLEVEDQPGHELSVLLPLAEEVRADEVALHAPGDAGRQFVVHSAANNVAEPVCAAERSLRQQVRASEQGVAPRLELLCAPVSNARAAAIEKQLHARSVRSITKTRSDVALEPDPIRGKASERRIEAVQVDRGSPRACAEVL